jgi:diguanylate cyclase (GGDEF)-like protein
MPEPGATTPRSSAPFPMMTPDLDFEAAAGMVLAYLNANVPLALWSVTRVENGRQTFLFLDDENGYGVTAGHSHPWEDSFCVHMAAGRGPLVAPDAQSVPVYAGARVNESAMIGAYAGAPIYEPQGDIFGAICGIDPENRDFDQALGSAGPLLSLLGQLLSMVVAADRMRDQAAVAVVEATLSAETDVLTGLHNRRAWTRILEEEERRFRRLADPTVAIVLDLDFLKTVNDTQGHQAGDTYIHTAGMAVRGAVKATDVVARLGGDEFGILLRGCTEAEADGAVERIYAGLAEHGVAGSLGWAPITVTKGFPAALAEADAAMYAAKAARRSNRRDVGDPVVALR